MWHVFLVILCEVSTRLELEILLKGIRCSITLTNDLLVYNMSILCGDRLKNLQFRNRKINSFFKKTKTK